MSTKPLRQCNVISRCQQGGADQAGMCLAAGMLARAISCWMASLPTAAGRATLHVVMQGIAVGAGWGRGVDGTGNLSLPTGDLCVGPQAGAPQADWQWGSR